MCLTGVGLAGSRITQRDVTYEKSVTYGPAAKLRRRDAGWPGRAIDMAIAQFLNCFPNSL